MQLTEIGQLRRAHRHRRPTTGVLYVAEQAGRVLAMAADGGTPREVLDMTDRTDGRGRAGPARPGLLARRQPRSTSATRTTTATPASTSTRSRADGVDPATRREVLAIEQPYSNHNGGGIAVRPGRLALRRLRRRRLGRRPAAQRPEARHAARQAAPHRPDARRRRRRTPSPPTTPSSGGGARPEIWSTGLRNPWRFSFDAATGDLWIGDVGQNAIEEIDLVPAADGAGQGTNFGWSALEGIDRYNDDQDADGLVDAGLRVRARRRRLLGHRRVRLPRRRPSRPSQGAYVFGDYCAAGVRALAADGNQVTDRAVLLDEPGQVVSFGTDEQGELYVVSLGGSIYRLDPA